MTDEVTERVARTRGPNVVHFLDGRNVHAYVRAVSTPDKSGPDNFYEYDRHPTRPSQKGVTPVQPRTRIHGPIGPTSA